MPETMTMETATVREVQHNLARILRRVEAGAEILIERRHRPVARLVPADAAAEQGADWSTHAAELAQVFGGRIVSGKPMEQVVAEARGER
jgi:prevent-host-death family protein